MALDEDVVRLARGANVATIVTVMPDGQPQAQLRWIDTDGEHLLVNTEPQRQAARNLLRDPRVTVLLHTAEDDHDWAEVRGRVARVVTGDEARANIDELSRKYVGTEFRAPVGPHGRILFVIAAEKVNTPARLSARDGSGD